MFTQAGKYEQSTQAEGPSSLNVMNWPSLVYKYKMVSLTHDAPVNRQVPAENVLPMAMVTGRSTYS